MELSLHCSNNANLRSRNEIVETLRFGKCFSPKECPNNQAIRRSDKNAMHFIVAGFRA